MRILVACEFSGVVRDAFLARGHRAVSCDLLPTESPGPHILGDVLEVLGDGWDMLIAHPPCTHLCVTGNRWMKPEHKSRFPNREQERKEAITFFLKLYNAPVLRVAVENPVGIMSTVFRKPDQYIHPYYFGERHSKKTGLWLRGLKKLEPTEMVEPEWYTHKSGARSPSWHRETLDLPHRERGKVRSKTFQGVAEAMAEQWGGEA